MGNFWHGWRGWGEIPVYAAATLMEIPIKALVSSLRRFCPPHDGPAAANSGTHIGIAEVQCRLGQADVAPLEGVFAAVAYLKIGPAPAGSATAAVQQGQRCAALPDGAVGIVRRPPLTHRLTAGGVTPQVRATQTVLPIYVKNTHPRCRHSGENRDPERRIVIAVAHPGVANRADSGLRRNDGWG